MLIPIGHEDQRVTRLPWVTIGLIAANVAVFLAFFPMAAQQATDTHQRFRDLVHFAREHPYLRLPEEVPQVIPTMRLPVNLSADVLAEQQAQLDRLINDFRASRSRSVYRTYGYIPGQPSLLTLFTPMFMHGGWLHLLGNMLFLWLSGTSLEDRWGRVLFPILFLVSGIAGTLAHGAMNSQGDIPMVGASGAIAGLMGAFLIRLATTRIRFFYWIYFARGTFYAPAYVVLPLWLLQQFSMASSPIMGGVAVWAHIGGFGVGVAAALLIRLTGLEVRVLAPAIEKKTTWTPSERLGAALGKLDRGDADGAIRELETLLRSRPDNIEARASLITAYSGKGDHVAAGRESARLVGGYLKARDMAGAMAAFREHKQTYPDVPLAMRDQVALAAHCERAQDYPEAAALYQEAIRAWPDDPLAPKALVGYGRLTLQVFNRPEEALPLFEQAQVHPRATAEFQQASTELLVAARNALRAAGHLPEAPSLPESDVPEAAAPPASPDGPAPEEPRDAVLPSRPERRLVPTPMRAVGIDAQGLTLQDPGGRTGRLAWPQVAAVSAASLGELEKADGGTIPLLILDLLLAPPARLDGDGVRCIRLSSQDLAIPQLQGEPSSTRAFQRLAATILKVTGAAPYPSREACLGLPEFPSFSDVAAYEAALVAQLPMPPQPFLLSDNPLSA